MMDNFLVRAIPNVVRSNVVRQALVVRKNSPSIFFGLGIVGTVASTVLACRATVKLPEKLDEINKEIEANKLLREIPADSDSPEAHMEELKHHVDTLHVYGRSAAKVVRLYSPAIIVGTVSITLLTSSHVQMARRNAALMTAYAGLSEFLEKYRNRVREEVGEDRELELYTGGKLEKREIEGRTIEARVVNPLHISPYAKFFDEYCNNWQRNPEYNRSFLEIQQSYANHKLNANGHVFLNEVYDMIGVPRTKAGAVVGWIKGGDGDSYISFGIFDAWNSNFVNGSEPSILLDFNVDGVIYDKI